MLEGHININCVEEEVDFNQVVRDLPFVLAYCEKFGMRDVEVYLSFENQVLENVYSFGDGIGSYTLQGVISSLK